MACDASDGITALGACARPPPPQGPQTTALSHLRSRPCLRWYALVRAVVVCPSLCSVRFVFAHFPVQRPAKRRDKIVVLINIYPFFFAGESFGFLSAVVRQRVYWPVQPVLCSSESFVGELCAMSSGFASLVVFMELILSVLLALLGPCLVCCCPLFLGRFSLVVFQVHRLKKQ